MKEVMRNYYGSLCTEMYEILHETAPQDELAFYLSLYSCYTEIIRRLQQRLAIVHLFPMTCTSELERLTLFHTCDMLLLQKHRW